MPASSSNNKHLSVHVSNKAKLKKTFPLLAKFATSKPSESSLTPGNANSARFSMFEKQGEIAVVGETKRIQYVSSSKNKLQAGVKYALGILDKNTQSLNILPMDHVFSLRQILKYPTEQSTADTVEFKDWLGKRVVKRINEQKTTLGKKVVLEKKSTAKGDLDAIASLLPEGYNKYAKKVMDIFPLSCVLPSNVYSSMSCATIEELATSATKREEYKQARGYQIALACCEKVYDKKEDNEEAVYLLEYAFHLAQIYLLSSVKDSLTQYLSDKSALSAYMTETFTERFGKLRAISETNKKKIVLHMLIVLLRVFGGRIPGYAYNAIMTDLAMTKNRLYNFTHLLGCTKDTSAVGGIILHVQKEKK